MANDIVQKAQVPAHLLKYQPARDKLSNFDMAGGTPFPVISTGGKKFAIKYKGDVFPAVDAEGYARQYLDVVIADANPIYTKTYYLGEFKEGSTDRPACYSLDGIMPEPDSPHVQNQTCADCRWNQWNTRGKGKACRDGKKLALLQTSNMDGSTPEENAGPILLRVPPASFTNFREYTAQLDREGRWPFGVVTRISFDPTALWGLNFQCTRWLDEFESDWVNWWREDPKGVEALHRVLGMNGNPVREVVAAAPEPEPEPEPEPVAQTPVAATPQVVERPRPSNATTTAATTPAPVQPAQAPLEPRQTPAAAAAPPAPRRAAPTPVAPPAAVRRAAPTAAALPAPSGTPAGNGAATPRRAAPVRAAAPAPARAAAPIQAQPELPAATAGADEDPYDVDKALEEAATNTQAIYDALDPE